MRVPILIYGCQRTATNLIMRLLQDSTDAYQANGELQGRGWKHADIDLALARQPVDGYEPRVVLCVRDPLAWMASCYDYFLAHKGADKTICRAFRRNWTFETFVHNRHYAWPNPAARWNDYYTGNSQAVDTLVSEERPAAIVRAEALATAAGQLAELGRLADELHLDLNGTPRAIMQRVNNRGGYETRRWDDREYVRRVRQHWTPALREWAVRQIDWDLARRFKYEPR